MTELTDADLVSRFQTGDRCAFSALVGRWEGFVLRVAARVTGDLNEAEEVRQAVFLRFLESPRAVHRPDRFVAWLRRMTVNESITSVRRRSRRQRTTDRLRARSVGIETPHTDDPLEAADEADRLALAMARLEPDERALLSLRFDEDLTFAEIAVTMGMPASTIKSRTTRLVARLRAMLNADHPADNEARS